MSYDEPKRYRQRTIVEAMRWMGDNQPDIEQWLERCAPDVTYAFDLDYIHILTVDGQENVDLGDWIVCSELNSITPCVNTEFQEHYELHS